MRLPLVTLERLYLLTLTLGAMAGMVFATFHYGVNFFTAAGLVAVSIALLYQILLPFSIAARLRAFLARGGPFEVFEDVIPRFRFVDYHKAVLSLVAQAKNHRLFRVQFPPLEPGLKAILSPGNHLSAQRADQRRLPIGRDRFQFFPSHLICAALGPPELPPEDRIVIRLAQSLNNVVLEIAAGTSEKAEGLLRTLHELAAKKSIYRGAFIDVRSAQQPAATEAASGVQAELTMEFKERPQVTRDDIVMEPAIQTVLQRSLFDFFRHREQLRRLGLPKKRTLLFYGPPGTGKTHTCRHIQTMLDGVTTIQVSGHAVTLLSHIGRFARQLHPTLVILEDIDLVFTQREVNAYAMVLGELMDQLDGFTEDEELLFVLTTNAIERVEQAIKDRPGRVNQCLYFPLPAAELRRQLLERMLPEQERNGLDLDHVARLTERTSQAFLRELVHRAIEVAAGETGYQAGTHSLSTAHFDVAFAELTSHGDPHGRAIMGFFGAAASKVGGPS